MAEKKPYKYYVVPGEVVSREDGQRHFVSADTLMDLYGVDPEECVIARAYPFQGTGMQTEGLRTLKPRWDGRYRL